MLAESCQNSPPYVPSLTIAEDLNPADRFCVAGACERETVRYHSLLVVLMPLGYVPYLVDDYSHDTDGQNSRPGKECRHPASAGP